MTIYDEAVTKMSRLLKERSVGIVAKLMNSAMLNLRNI